MAGTEIRLCRYCGMQNDTGPKARTGMFTFVLTIFAVALVVAGIYMIGFTPGETG
ncbi:hypothetical protein [Rhizobium oryzicola]|uniref:Uncharacterized protein n=1 Tax=Rhizobium oryzicola TaxID=1232668 RepID=A0ABT8SS94_9HYPH|nr:hypothetical protein [Rhizobium oryzicola]MDO1581274.1 hypothetical protein [Rhizobium oryzicola]